MISISFQNTVVISLEEVRIHLMLMKTFYTKSGRKSGLKVSTFSLRSFLFRVNQRLFTFAEIENAEANLVESLVSQCSSHAIVCPICLKLPAQLDESHYLTCTCGLKFLLPSHIDLKDFEDTILTSNDIHSETCDATPVYEVRPTEGNTLQFISSCESCLYFNTILETPI